MQTFSYIRDRISGFIASCLEATDKRCERFNQLGENYGAKQNSLPDEKEKVRFMLKYSPATMIAYQMVRGLGTCPTSFIACWIYSSEDDYYIYDYNKCRVYLVSYKQACSLIEKVTGNPELFIDSCFSRAHFKRFLELCPHQIVRQVTAKEKSNLYKRFRRNLLSIEEIFDDL